MPLITQTLQPTAVLYDSGEIGVAAASFDVTGIAATWVDLLIIAQVRGDTAATAVSATLTVNNDSGANYDNQQITAAATSPSASEALAAGGLTLFNVAGGTAPANAVDCVEILISSYASTAWQKAFLWRQSRKSGIASGNNFIREGCAWWRNTAAINRVTFTPAAGNWIAGSRLRILGRS